MNSPSGQSRPYFPAARNRGKIQSGTERLSADVGGLEASLLQMVNDHQYTSNKLRENSEKAKKDAIQKSVRVSDLLVDAVNGGVQGSFVNQKLIELEIRALAATISRFMKQTDQWLAATHALNTAVKYAPWGSPQGVAQQLKTWALKEIGDFENWIKTIDFDCKSITTAIHNIYQD